MKSGWCGTMSAGKPQVEYIYLPGGKEKMTNRIVRDFPAIHKTQRAISKDIDQLIADLYNGKKRILIYRS
ncbi:MAG: hypothetical protein MZV70_25295 [Desulfobacterales bacterium]|nr:hypothetical protein [Desulfobacterales bacterium]